MTKILHKITGEVIFEDASCNTLREAVEKAIELGADLSGADLRGADLRGAYLSGADLYHADLRDADLRSAYLIDATLRGANLRGANLRGAKFPPELEALKKYNNNEFKLDLINKALAPEALKMHDWHCGTSHCIAGWASHLSNSEELEGKYPVHLIGYLCLGHEWASHFYDSDEDAAEFLLKTKKQIEGK